MATVDFSGYSTFAQSFARTAMQSIRPQMELQINQLQNAVIDRLNVKIGEVTADINYSDRALRRQLNQTQVKLNNYQINTEKYLFDNGRNMMTVDGLVLKLTELNTALTANDTPTFNAVLKEINWMVGVMHRPQGFKVGLQVNDGVQNLKTQGLVTFDNAGTKTQATSRADFATDADASASITAAIAETSRLSAVMNLNQVAGEGLRSTTEGKIRSTLLQIEVTRLANETDKANEVEKLRSQYAQLLQAFSLAYESNVALAEKMQNALFESPDKQPGSIMSLFA